LQTWFIGTGHHDGKDPYFLYAASNVGSFLALLSYPVVLEPLFTLQVQDRLWTVGFVLLVALIAACAILLLRSPASTVTANDVDAIAAKPNWLTIGRWVFVSAVPSGLLVALGGGISDPGRAGGVVPAVRSCAWR
jgi:hypothetical protein